MKTNPYDLTQGSILDKLLLVALPIMGTEFLQMVYNLTDMFWLGRVSHEAVAAIGSAGMYMWLSNAFLLIGQTGAGIGVAQSLGKGNAQTAQQYAQTALSLSLLLGISFSVAMLVFRAPLIGFFQIREAQVVYDAQTYLSIVALGIPFTFLTATGCSCFNSSGNARMSFKLNLIGLTFNIIMDPLMIYVWGWGVTGAAVSTAAGQMLSCLLTLLALKFARNRPFEHIRFKVRPTAALTRQIFRWSTPVVLESMFFTLLSMPITRIVAAWGAGAMAVQRVGSQIESLSWLISGGFSKALTSFVGQNFGAGKWTRIHRGFRLSSVAMVLWGTMVTAVLLAGGRLLFTMFLPDPVTIDAGVGYLRILLLCQIPICLENVALGHFQGIGKTIPPSIASITSNALRVPLAYALSRSGLGLTGVWVGITVGAVVRGLWLYGWNLLYLRKEPKVDCPPVSAA